MSWRARVQVAITYGAEKRAHWLQELQEGQERRDARLELKDMILQYVSTKGMLVDKRQSQD
jgi:hypothetical protein